MSGREKEKMVRLVQAAAIARMGYHKMLDKVLRSEVRGHQDSNGRWWVREDDARKLGREREPAPTTA